MPVPEFQERFWASVEIGEPDDCWPWKKSLGGGGYGQISRDGKNVSAHRAAYELARGPIPVGRSVLHTCDYPPCCNPAHLFVGTQGDNVRDMLRKGRGVAPPVLHGDRLGARRTRGEAHKNARLDAAAVREIRELAAATSQRSLARRFGVSRATIKRVVERTSWAHV